MPVYLCSPGVGEAEPWKHVIQVFKEPFDVNETKVTGTNGTVDWAVALETLKESGPTNGTTVRKIRHSEVVLVDDVCVAYDRYWLRLRWPGSKGGFAGYIAMNKFGDEANPIAIIDTTFSPPEDQAEAVDDPLEDDRGEENNSMQSSEPFEADDRRMICRRTALPFPTSGVFKLLSPYDDQVQAALPPFPTEHVFCRICRDGLHDDAEELPAAAGDETEAPQPVDQNRGLSPTRENSVISDDTCGGKEYQGPVLPHPKYTQHSELVKNPMMAPCECSGSMAFVHFFCVEQWRCRSRHPAAMNGLNCETCKAPYALPPPEDRHQANDPEWQDAMPPHVMQALRQPHIWWQIGAAIVRRRWLRPLAPVIMSPLVALYCRARRLLKKRGVARRRWACSLCRRRARWKCVRCLRSYYCSRQCQNVSWHIIHKHVCYKPVRMYQSIAFYGILAITLFPGIIRDPFMYEIGFSMVPVSFVIMGILGGGIATLLKKLAGVDLRGRRMELAVVVATILLTIHSWGLLRAFFGNSSACHGVFGRYSVSEDELSSSYLLRLLHWAVFKPTESVLHSLDTQIARGIRWTGICPSLEEGKCLEHIGQANASFFSLESGGERCAADVRVVSGLYVAAVCSFIGSAVVKHHERQLRRRRHHHQD